MACEFEIHFGDGFTGAGTATDKIEYAGSGGQDGNTPQPVWTGTSLAWDLDGDGTADTTPVDLKGDTGSGGGGGGSTPNTAVTVAIANNQIAVTVTDSSGTVTDSAPFTALLQCSETVTSNSQALTGTRVSPRRVIGCQAPSLGGDDPETAGFDADDFPPGWEQDFSGGVSGDETWIMQPDTQGDSQWHQQN